MTPIDFNVGATTVVIFGASGDLTRRKLIPALYNNFKKKRLTAGLQIVGFARREWSDDQFRDRLESGVKEYGAAFDAGAWNDFARHIRYIQGNLDVPGDYQNLHSTLNDMEKEPADRLYYLATDPDLYGQACEHLYAAGMTAKSVFNRTKVFICGLRPRCRIRYLSPVL